MRTYKLTIAYDGTRYQGWQRQAATPDTIQGIIEKAISQTVGYPVTIDGSGRTDAGVHAAGQTASVVLGGMVQSGFFTEQVNERLPEDIRIVSEELVRNGFHARKSASGKKYEYRVDTADKPDVFTRRYAWHYPHRLDLAAMREAAQALCGTHDFAGYTDKKYQTSTTRTIYDIMICGRGSSVTIEYWGTGFMYHMVRILTGTLLEVGAGRRTPEEAAHALVTKERADAGFLAPASGLFLKEVQYETNIMECKRDPRMCAERIP